LWATFQYPVASACHELIGLRYRLGADGSNGEIDCIHLVYEAQRIMGIKMPVFKSNWYTASRFEVARDLLKWGNRVDKPLYDGDVVLLPQTTIAFGVTWDKGILHISQQRQAVHWCPTRLLTTSHCFRMKSS
jgi:cell wall-associated NlpC family hydrolase